MSEPQIESLPEIPTLVPPAAENVPSFPYNIALLINDVVYQVMNVDGKTASEFMAQPKFVQVGPDAKIGWIYKDGTFVSPFDETPPIDTGV